jgi:glycosyltransferase involved in cell wall biosynthesis
MISVLIPIYNGVEYLEESIQSVITQTYSHWEIIIGINGHPPDSYTYYMAKQYESDKIHIYDFGVTNENDPNLNGKSITLNKMIPYCKYNHVAILDVDDIWLPNKLEIQSRFVNSNYDVVGSHCVYFGDLTGQPNIPQGDLIHFKFTTSNPIINSSVIIRKELCNWDITTFVEDYELWLRLNKQNKTFYNCTEILVKHRICKSSAFNSNPRQHVDLQKLLEKYRSHN